MSFFHRTFVTVLTLLFTVSTLVEAARIRGYTATELYTFEDAAETQHSLFYQTLSLRVASLGSKSLTLNSMLRYQGDSADDFAESGSLKIHTLNLRWSPNASWEARLGRQFLAEGVGFGTYDAIRVGYTFTRKSQVIVWGGVSAPLSREAELEKAEEYAAVGLRFQQTVARSVMINLSYLHGEREGDLFRHRAGVSVSSNPLPNLHGTVLAYLNLEGPATLHRLRILLRYLHSNSLRLFAEAAQATPELPPDSPFANVPIEAVTLLRLGGSYQIFERYWVGLRTQSLLSGNEPNVTLGFSLEGPWGEIGYRQRFGDFGDESGIWGYAQYRPAAFLQLYAGVDFSQYSFVEYDNDDQSALQAGFRLYPIKSLELGASLQRLQNRQFNEDWRSLFNLKWTFGD
ncbi:MAG: hypothetical protein ABH878_10775 [bacterium]